ncbi:methyltransferase-like protein 27 [Pollicipes pollicipes]|uniref:methyltransferase-like protein 27 n=1 Tax=Pollicipes pollicipes TaxID=41117 RepID=UPI0018856D4A|nr:methyltransferase-like protein 27 [Pollicipes pollicipes]
MACKAGVAASVGPSQDRQLVHRLIHCNSADEVLDQYESTADEYESYFLSNAYDAHRLAAAAVLRLFPKHGPVSRGDLSVMDVACGTGLVAQVLHDAGVVHLDALDASSKMIEISRARGVYRRLIQDTIGSHRIDVQDNTYDAVTVAGGFVQGHLPVTAFDEMIRICKPGGYIVNSMRFEYLVTVKEYHELEPHMDRLERAGLWRQVDRYVTDGYFQHVKQGITHVYQKL